MGVFISYDVTNGKQSQVKEALRDPGGWTVDGLPRSCAMKDDISEAAATEELEALQKQFPITRYVVVEYQGRLKPFVDKDEAEIIRKAEDEERAKWSYDYSGNLDQSMQRK